MLAARVARMVTLRRKARAERKVAVVLFNFPPNAGTVGTAAYLSVFASLLNTLRGMKDAGYNVEVPEASMPARPAARRQCLIVRHQCQRRRPDAGR